MIIEINYEWKIVKQTETENYVFPNEPNNYMIAQYNKHAIYKWELKKDDTTEKNYIGQTNELVPRRLKQYMSPDQSQATNKRINCEIDNWQVQHGAESVKFYVLSLSKVQIGNNEIDIDEKMESKNFRELIESVLIEELRIEHEDSFFLNKLDRDVEECRKITTQLRLSIEKNRRLGELLAQ